MSDIPTHESTSTPAETEETRIAIGEATVQVLRDEQNLFAGLLAGLFAAIAGAAIWAIVTALTGYQIGWMAVGVGFLVGLAVRSLGKGIDKIFGVMGALLGLFGCLLGNLLAVCYFISDAMGIAYFDVVMQLTPAIAIEILQDTFTPIDLLFYGIAIYEAYRFSFRNITEDDLANALAQSGGQLEEA